jgi:hypothetical protein
MKPANELLNRVYSLALAQLEGTLAAEEQRELESLIVENSTARRWYLQFVEESACLRWLCVDDVSHDVQPASLVLGDLRRPRRRWSEVIRYLAGVACMLLAAVGASQLLNRRSAEVAAVAPANGPSHPPVAAEMSAERGVATITGLESVRWSDPQTRGRLLGRCAIGDRISFQAGAAQLTFDAGAQVAVFGPADFEITSATSILCARGRVTTLVGERGKGFTIETPRAKVVDLGTQFGLSISDEGETEVVVFRGSVDLKPLERQGVTPSRRMRRGEALILKNSGELERIVSVERNSFLSALESVRRRPAVPVIGDVRDNIRPDQSVMSYQIVHAGLEEDSPCFVDRDHQWNGADSKGLPEFLMGADYIMPFNDDKFVRGLELTVRLVRPATLYVFLDNNMAVPDWLRKDFVDTGLDIGMDGSKTPWHQEQTLSMGAGRSIDCRFSIWKRDIREAGSVMLGGIEPPKVRSQGFNMYGIAAVALD